MLSCYYSVSMATLTGLEPAFIVLETTAYPPCSRVYLYVALSPGFEPELRRPQHRVLTNYTKTAFGAHSRSRTYNIRGLNPSPLPIGPYGLIVYSGAPGEIRTPTTRNLNPVPLPVGLQGQTLALLKGIEPSSPLRQRGRFTRCVQEQTLQNLFVDFFLYFFGKFFSQHTMKTALILTIFPSIGFSPRGSTPCFVSHDKVP